MGNHDRARAAVKMRLIGHTYRSIGERLGVNTQRAYQIIQWMIGLLLDPLFPPETPEDQYLSDAISNSPYLTMKGRVVFLDNQMEN